MTAREIRSTAACPTCKAPIGEPCTELGPDDRPSGADPPSRADAALADRDLGPPSDDAAAVAVGAVQATMNLLGQPSRVLRPADEQRPPRLTGFNGRPASFLRLVPPAARPGRTLAALFVGGARSSLIGTSEGGKDDPIRAPSNRESRR